MATQDMSKLSRYDMVDIILSLEKNEKELRQELAESHRQIAQLQSQLTAAIEVARAALQLRDFLGVLPQKKQEQSDKGEASGGDAAPAEETQPAAEEAQNA